VGNVEILIILVSVAVLLVEVAQRLGVPYPIVLIIGGALVSFVPGTHNIRIDPNLILLVILPPILYYTAFWISNREFKKNLREIVSLALGLVIATTIVVACLFKWFFPELPWALAFVFGALISPPDATAAKAILQKFALSPKLSNILEGESLINDATGIVLYKFALLALASGSFSLIEFGENFFKNAIGGIGVGVVLGYGMQLFSRFYLGPVVAGVFSFTIPYVTYVIADHLEVSGVLAVVVNGLIGSHVVISHKAARRRIAAFAAWDVFYVLINCLVFVLIGVQMRQYTSKMSIEEIVIYTGYGIVITAVIIIVRFVWIFIYKCTVGKSHKGNFFNSLECKEGIIMAWSSMRGIVSLALAVALPYTLPNNSRAIILHLTFIIIFLTLLTTGLSLPYLIKKLKVPVFNKESPALVATRRKLKQLAEKKIMDLNLGDADKQFLTSYFFTHHAILENPADEAFDAVEKGRLQILDAQRLLLLELWRNEEVEDHELVLLQQELDLESSHVARGEI
jgi:CPA1 family monovalent cation:H+ antiporter